MRVHLLSAAAVLCVSLAAHADSFAFAAYGNGINASFTIQTTPTSDPAIDEITGITGTFSSSGPYPNAGKHAHNGTTLISWSSGPFSGPITGLLAGSYSAANPTINTLSAWDNLFYPSGGTSTCYGGTTNQIFDNCGLNFIVANTYQVNLWGLGGVFDFSDGNLASTVYYDSIVPVTLVATPEPSSLVLLGTGLLGALGAARRIRLGGMGERATRRL